MRGLAIVLALLQPAAPVAPPAVAGIYRADGLTPDGRPYEYEAWVYSRGAVVEIWWARPGCAADPAPCAEYWGLGVWQDAETLLVTYLGVGGLLGLGMYRVAATTPRAFAGWYVLAPLGGAGLAGRGTERWTWMAAARVQPL